MHVPPSWRPSRGYERQRVEDHRSLALAATTGQPEFCGMPPAKHAGN